MRLWYWLREDLKEDQSTAEWVRFQRFSAWRTEDLKARSVEVNQGLDLVCDRVMSALSAVLLIFSFQFSLHFSISVARQLSGVRGLPNIGHLTLPKILERTFLARGVELWGMILN